MQAYLCYKRKELFPTKSSTTNNQKRKVRNKVIVSAFKGIQSSVSPRNWRVKHKKEDNSYEK